MGTAHQGLGRHGRPSLPRAARPFTLTVIADGRHLATRVDGHQVTDRADVRPEDDDPRQGLRTGPGTTPLQAHAPGTDVESRSVRVGDLGERGRSGR